MNNKKHKCARCNINKKDFPDCYCKPCRSALNKKYREIEKKQHTLCKCGKPKETGNLCGDCRREYHRIKQQEYRKRNPSVPGSHHNENGMKFKTMEEWKDWYDSTMPDKSRIKITKETGILTTVRR